MRSNLTIICLAITTLGCQPPFEATTIEGTWTTTSIQFNDNRCGLEDSVAATMDQQTYTMGTANTDEDENGYNDQLTETIVDNMRVNIWSHCNFDNSPELNCSLPLPAIHFSLWSSTLVGTEENPSICNEAPTISGVSGNTYGIFIDENSAHFTSYISITCPQEQEETCSTEMEFKLGK